MDVTVTGAAMEAFVALMDPFRLMMLGGGVLIGLMLGIFPGIGGLAGMALLLPFTYAMDTTAALAMLMGMLSVSGTSDTIPAVLFGVPGTVGAQATVMDGHPMAKRGEAGRALSAAYTASLFGGLIGAGLLALTIPVLRPFILYIGSPELLSLSFLGVSMVAILAGKTPMRGLIAACLGVLLSMIGSDPTTGTLRWTMGTFYLWDGLPLVPMVLGLFALPELADLAIRRMAISSEQKYDTRAGMMQGFKDALKNWGLVFRGGIIGAGVGAIPGLGASVVDWIAYGVALKTEKGAQNTFGKGDVRGVIAPESANNALTAGSLVPTIAFGVPGSATTAILLGVFLIHGIIPGPEMLTKNLSVTYSMVWSIALANILGAGICFLFSGYLAKIALLRYTLIMPGVIIFIFLGSYQASTSWGDLVTLLIFALVGWTMKQLRWPRPPLILGFVLGTLIERYMFISISRYGWDWLTRPIVAVVLIIAISLILSSAYQHFRSMGGVKGVVSNFSAPKFRLPDLMHVVGLAIMGYMVFSSMDWLPGARIAPMIIGGAGVVLGIISLTNQVFSRAIIAKREAAGEMAQSHTVHMDSEIDMDGLPYSTLLKRGLVFFFYLLTFCFLAAVIGFLPTIPVFTFLYLRVEGRENWKQVTGQCVALTAVTYIIFERLLHVPWPRSFIGEWVPVLAVIPSV